MIQIFCENLDPNNTTLCRYMSTEKFISLLDKKALYFSAASHFDDNFEGVITATSSHSPSSVFNSAFKALQKFAMISCWHESNFESVAMWKIYSKENKGVAIKTNINDLLKSINEYRIKPELIRPSTFGHSIK